MLRCLFSCFEIKDNPSPPPVVNVKKEESLSKSSSKMPIVTVTLSSQPARGGTETVEICGLPSGEIRHFQGLGGTVVSETVMGVKRESVVISAFSRGSGVLRPHSKYNFDIYVTMSFANPVLEVLDKLRYKVVSSHGGGGEALMYHHVFVLQKK